MVLLLMLLTPLSTRVLLLVLLLLLLLRAPSQEGLELLHFVLLQWFCSACSPPLVLCHWRGLRRNCLSYRSICTF